MKNILALFVFFSFTSIAWSKTPTLLKCIEGQYVLEADFLKKKINIFENERSLFGFAHTIKSHHLYSGRASNNYYYLDLKIKNDGIVKGKFNLVMESGDHALRGEVEYHGWFSWESISFNECELHF